MPLGTQSLGIIGGNGALGSAIATALIETGTLAPGQLWVASRSGTAGHLEKWPEIRVVSDNQVLADTCDIVMLSVPPAQIEKVRIKAPEKLVISVMAGVTAERIAKLTGARRIVRAMSSPAAARQQAYSVWHATTDLTDKDRQILTNLFSACGAADEICQEHMIDVFTALTGPVPGFVAYFAACMQSYATGKGVPAAIAERAVRQLFLASGNAIAHDKTSPLDQVEAMIEYAGTTAQGLTSMQAAPLEHSIHQGLDAARVRAIEIGNEIGKS